MPTAYIGIGSNLGDRKENCEKAIRLLEKSDITVTTRSSMIETEPWGLTDQPAFVNMAVEIDTQLRPEELLFLLKKIEREVGRSDSVRWGPRTVDLDILLFNDLVMKTPQLEIPHHHISTREFVLRPLAEIAPDRMHPVLKKSINKLLNELIA
jgi:2-amino-4-hydroxy-6-hydroxymethyldihydropteridine diphosphokinase